MTRIHTLLGTAALALAFGAATTLAQTSSTPSTSTKTATTAVKKAPGNKKQPTTAIGKQCSAEADTKGLHGAERKKSRAECKKRLTAAAKT